MTDLERAMFVAQRVHANQSYDIYPYIFHIQQVVNVAKSLGFEDVIVVSCALHDVLEDGFLSYNDLKKGFGLEVAEIVYAVTDELGRNRKERKEKTYPKIKANWKAQAVKLCDRIANVEHSKYYNERLYEMYTIESSAFLNSIGPPPENLIKAWDRLIKLS